MRMRTWMICCAAVASIGTLCASDARATLPPAAAFPFTFVVGGAPQPGLFMDLISFTYDDQTERTEFTLNNWENLQYKYSDGPLFSPGATVALYTGYGTSSSKKVSEGAVTEVASKFPRDTTATLTITVVGSPRRAISSTVAVPLAYHNELHEFYPVQKRDGSISCSGTTTGRPGLSKGMTVRVSNVGARFNGDYGVSGTVHTFDRSQGYRTTFTGTRAAAPTTPSAGGRRAFQGPA